MRKMSGPLVGESYRAGRKTYFACDAKNRVTQARHSSGRMVSYEYDAGGKLVHVHDSQNGDEYYQYDFANRFVVSDLNKHHQLVNTYGYLGEVTSQTLADHRKLIYSSDLTNSSK